MVAEIVTFANRDL